MSPSNDNSVVELDIREEPVEDAEDQAYEIVRSFRFRRSSGRVIVIDDALSVRDHESIYRVIQAHQGANLLCVAVGGPASRASGIALRTTQLLNNQTAATLWVGDPDGVSWPTRTTPTDEAPLLSTQPETLRSLREILRMPEVFDQVIRMADGLPFHVASPGHLVAAGQVGPVQLAAAQLASVDQIAGAARPLERTSDDDAAANDYWPLITTEEPDSDQARLRANSPLETTRTQTDELLRWAQNEVAAIDGPFGPRLTAPPSDALNRTIEAGRTLAEFRRSVGDLFSRIDVREGLTSAARDRLVQAGVDMRELHGSQHLEIAARLKDRLAGRLTSGRSLRETAEYARRIAEYAGTAGTKGRVADLEARCPQGLLDRLAKPPNLPWRLLTPWVLAVVVGAGLLASVGPFGIVVGIVLALAWTAYVFAASTRLPRTGDDAVRFDPWLVVHLGAALAGAAAGAAIMTDAHPSAPVGWIGVGVAVVALPLTMRIWWSRATLDWGLAGLLSRAQQANTDIVQLLSRVAVREWVAGDARRFVSHGAFEIGIALDAVAEALGEWLPPTHTGGPANSHSAVGEELQRLVTEDIRHVVTTALERSWRALEAGTFDEVTDGVREHAVNLLNDYSLHLENVGIDEPFQPDGVVAAASRGQLVRQLWQESSDINWLMYDAGADSPMLQLCAPEDVFLLDGERDNFGLIRFAPRAARGSVTASRPAGYPNAEITWTGASHVAGVLRLVPLRGKAVDISWPATKETDDDE